MGIFGGRRSASPAAPLVALAAPVGAPTTPPPPTQLDPAVRRIRQGIANRQRASGGRQSTIKTSIRGLDSPVSLAKKTLLGA